MATSRKGWTQMKIRFGWGPASFAVSLLALLLALGGAGYTLAVASASPTTVEQGGATVSHAPNASHRWHNLTLTSGWRYGGARSFHAAYYKDSQGIVHLRGSAADGTKGPVFTLPPGYRPSHSIRLPILAVGGSAGAMTIVPTGQAYLYDANGNRNVVNYSSFDGISFPVP